MGDNEASSVRGILEKTAAAVLAAAVVAGAGALAGLHDRVVAGQHAITRLTDESADLRKRIEQQEQRPPRLNSGLDEVRKDCDKLGDIVTTCRERVGVIERDVRHIETEQTRLCDRIRACR